MEILSTQQLTDLACIRYGQLVTPTDIYNLTQETCETLLKDVVEEYTQYIPMTKILNVMGSPSGVFLGNDIISVRNTRMNNFYFNKLSPRMDRRQRRFDAHSKMLYTPFSMPIIVECGAHYPVGRMPITEQVDTYLPGDTYIEFKLENYRRGSLTIQLGDYSWKDSESDYCCKRCSDNKHNIVFLDGVDRASDAIDVFYNLETHTLRLSEVNELDISTEMGVVAKYNTNVAVVQGLGLRDKLFIDLFIGRLMLALGNIKSQLVMEGDITAFSSDDLITQGTELVNSTLELLHTSSTSYKVI